MKVRITILTLSLLGAIIGTLAGGVYADGNVSSDTIVYETNGTSSTDNPNLTDTNLSLNNLYQNVSQTGNLTEDLVTDEQGDEQPVIYSGIVHPDTDTDVTRSTPTGNPLIPGYALGGVSVDINAHLMEGRGTDTNPSSDISLSDHTDAYGYIKTIIKDFHYESGVDPSAE